MRITQSVSRYDPPRELYEDDGSPADWILFNYPIADIELAANALDIFHCLPYAGGAFDQPTKLLDDLFVWFAIKARLKYEENPERYRPPGSGQPMPFQSPEVFDLEDFMGR